MADLRPVGSFGAKHGPNTPSRTEHVERFGEAVVVNDAGVDGKNPHQQDDVATSKHHVEHLQRHETTSGYLKRYVFFCVHSYLDTKHLLSNMCCNISFLLGKKMLFKLATTDITGFIH